ncbi:MAG: hypothetical protein ACYTFV_10320 [Planctomycetota bacterium]|jgi:hypothetical protein
MRRILSLLIVLSLGIPASAQGVKKGGWFEDTTRIGFKLRSPKGWVFTPGALADPIDSTFACLTSGNRLATRESGS